jgi:hypothetical protein
MTRVDAENTPNTCPPPPGDPAHKRPVRIHFSAPVTAPLRGGGLHITAKHLVHSIMHFAASFAGSCRSVTWGWTQRRQPRRATCTRGAESAVVSSCMQGKSSVASQRTLYSASRGRSLASTASTRAGPSKPPSAASAVPARATTNALGTSPCRSCGTSAAQRRQRSRSQIINLQYTQPLPRYVPSLPPEYTHATTKVYCTVAV